MIVRRESNGWRLITQPAHAWLAGALAAAWGAPELRRPEPYEAVVLATRLHDIGWLERDEAPEPDDVGAPRNFIDTPLEATAPIWRRAVRRTRLLDPYAAILVSRHATTIYQSRLARGIDHDPDAVRALLAEQAAWRAGLSASLADHPRYGAWLSEAAQADAYRWLRACDLLSLVLCSDALPARGEVPDVPGPQAGDYQTLHYDRPGWDLVRLAPWPFAAPELRLDVETRLLPTNRYTDPDALRRALAEAPWATQAITVAPLA